MQTPIDEMDRDQLHEAIAVLQAQEPCSQCHEHLCWCDDTWSDGYQHLQLINRLYELEHDMPRVWLLTVTEYCYEDQSEVLQLAFNSEKALRSYCRKHLTGNALARYIDNETIAVFSRVYGASGTFFYLPDALQPIWTQAIQSGNGYGGTAVTISQVTIWA